MEERSPLARQTAQAPVAGQRQRPSDSRGNEGEASLEPRVFRVCSEPTKCAKLIVTGDGSCTSAGSEPDGNGNGDLAIIDPNAAHRLPL